MVSSSKPAAPFVFGDIQTTRHTYLGLPPFATPAIF